MNDDWAEANNAYLVESFAWVRARLSVLIDRTQHSRRVGADVVGRQAPRRGWLARLFHRSSSAPVRLPTVKELGAGATGLTRPADNAVGAAAALGVALPAHVELAEKLMLSPFEADVLLLVVGAQLDPSIARMCLEVDPACDGHPTFALALRLFDESRWDALAPHRPLRRLSLVSVDDSAGVVNGRLRTDERVVNFIKGLNHLDERIGTLLAPMRSGGSLGVTESQRAAVDLIVRHWHNRSGQLVVNLVGADSVSKRLIADEVGTSTARFPARMPAANLPAASHELETVGRLWDRDWRLTSLSLYLDASDDMSDELADVRRRVDRLLSRVGGLVFVDSREVWSSVGASTLVVDVASPTSAEQRAVWAAATGDEPLARQLSGQFDLDIVAIEDLARDFAGGEDVWAAAVRSTRPQLDRLAQRVDVKAARDDLVVSPAVSDQLERIEDQVRLRATVYSDWGLAARTSRGLGITALFAGESGTGKTLAAEVIAHELRLDLYRIDLSAVVSKYIGETEKHLRQLFDAAERGGTVLFFDEADALFGKRSEVRDSHDRYANIEVNYLLQRMESFQGLAILATNMKSSLDQAFARRLRFVVDFPFPEQAQRERIWRRSFVPSVDTGELDFARLARFSFTGGSIYNAAVNATFELAAHGAGAVTMPMVLGAVRLEYRKLGMTVNEAEFVSAAAPEIPEMSGAAS